MTLVRDHRALAPHYDTAIVGAGIAGCASALALAQKSPFAKILVVDVHAGGPSSRFSGEFIHPRGVAVLSRLGLEGPLLEEGALRSPGFVVHEHPEASATCLFYPTTKNAPNYGLSLDHVRLQTRIRSIIAKHPRIDFLPGWRFLDFSPTASTHLRLQISSTKTKEAHALSCGLLIGADGKSSRVRQAAGYPVKRQALGYTAGLEVTLAPNAKLPYANCGQVVLGAPGPMLCYGINCEGEAIKGFRITFDLPGALEFKGEGLRQHLLRAYIPHLPAAFAEAAANALMQHRSVGIAPVWQLRTQIPASPALLLVGDAASCAHPITASGMSMALLDAQILGSLAPDSKDKWPKFSRARFVAQQRRHHITRHTLADALAAIFRGQAQGERCMQEALFAYWSADPANRRRSLSLLSGLDTRPSSFLREYLKTARHALQSCASPKDQRSVPIRDRLYRLQRTSELAANQLSQVAELGWTQMRPLWWNPSALGIRENLSPSKNRPAEERNLSG